jgi:hypothetical protein
MKQSLMMENSLLKFRVFWDVAPRSHVEVEEVSEVCTASIIGAIIIHRPDQGGNTHL